MTELCFSADVDDSEIREHRETYASRLRDGRFDSGHRFDGQEFSGTDDVTFRRPSNHIYAAIHVVTGGFLGFRFTCGQHPVVKSNELVILLGEKL